MMPPTNITASFHKRSRAGRHITRVGALLFAIIILLSSPAIQCKEPGAISTGSVILVHPDGSGLGMWTALRLIDRGPDGETNWDRLEAMGIYLRPEMFMGTRW